jgi:8-oxo-dGTP diphosphatase
MWAIASPAFIVAMTVSFLLSGDRFAAFGEQGKSNASAQYGKILGQAGGIRSVAGICRWKPYRSRYKVCNMAKPVTPLLAVDCVVLDPEGRVLLIKRGHPPFKGQYALPGGFVDVGETVEDACRRELMEETGVKVGKLTLVGVFSDPARDPRGHTVTVSFLARVRAAKANAGDDAAAVEWVSNWQRLKLGFDHKKILKRAMQIAAGPKEG